LTFGMTPQNPVGVRAAAAVAGGLCLIGLLIFTRYNEKAVIGILATKEKV